MPRRRLDRINQATRRLLLEPAFFLNTTFLYVQRMELACARGTLGATTRRFHRADPSSWEFSAFSQNGEDGITDYLLSLVREPNRYFVEIGASDGLENNSSYLAFVKKYSGVMVDADSLRSATAHRLLRPFNWGVDYLNMSVTPDNSADLAAACLYGNPDFFSLDIDGNDYHVAKALFDAARFRPKVVCVEYNSAYGPDASMTIQYTASHGGVRDVHPSGLYYGVSLAGWQTFFAVNGYAFVTVESNGVNAFFVDPAAIHTGALEGLRPLAWRENHVQHLRFRSDWTHQYELIRAMPHQLIT